MPIIVLAAGFVACLLVRKIGHRRLRGQKNENIAAKIRGMPMETNLDAWMRQVDWVYSEELGNEDKEDKKNEKEMGWEAIEREMQYCR